MENIEKISLLDIGGKLNVYKSSRRSLGRLMNVLKYVWFTSCVQETKVL